jgi:Protein of unknown function (DUF2924)
MRTGMTQEERELAKPSVADTAAMDRAGLCRTWVLLFGTAVPKSLSLPLLRRFIAFELQARRFGGLPKGFVETLTKHVAAEGAAQRAAATQLRAGARLLREWAGVTHVVEVVEGGYLWRGNRHRSLTAIAQAITGAHWSGPRFFGLTAQVAEAGRPARRAGLRDG